MFEKFFHAVYEAANHYAETSAQDSVYNVYADMLRDRMNEER